ncbi:hypothetical protein Vi05172_g12015 [Venturia inaequalis]|nr:hypothetical protein Vi05172_g12015 [Venturia inaequalis]
MHTLGPFIVLPPHLLDEIKKADDIMDNASALSDITLTDLTGVTSTSPMMNHIVKGDLTVALNRINPRLSETAEESVATEMPPCSEWTQVHWYKIILNVIATVSGDIFLGRELCRNEDYMKMAVGYTVNAFTGINKLRLWWKPLRIIGRYFVPELRLTNKLRANTKKFLAPIIRQRRAMLEQGVEVSDDLMTWSLRKIHLFPGEMKSDDDVAFMQLRLSTAAIHSTSLTGVLLMRDIASQPGLVRALRDEMEDVLARHNGVFTINALYQMKLLDSVMKESQRMHMLGPSMYRNKALVGLTLSDGTYIPPNVRIVSATLAASMDPSIWTNPETFDPYRFVNLRKASEEAGRHQFVTVTKDMIAFGYGKHTCPGRFFAANELKIIFITILRNYDVEIREGGSKWAPNLYFKKIQ